MAKKGNTRKQPRELTKRQISKWQQQQRRQRITFITGVTIIAVALILILVGWFLTQFQPLHETVIQVNDTRFDMKYYIDTLKFYGSTQSAEYVSYIAEDAIDDIEERELVRQAALELGMSVSDDEIKEKLEGSDLPDSNISSDVISYSILVNKLLGEHFDSEVPVTAEQAHIMAMLLESESQALEVRDRLGNGESFAELAGELSLESFTKNSEGDLGWHPESILKELFYTEVPVDYAFNGEVGKLSEPLYDEEVSKSVGYWLIKVTEREEGTDSAHVYAILLGSEDEAAGIKARLEAGEDFATVAKENSLWYAAETNEGDLGMVSRGSTTTVLDEYVFDNGIELNTLSGPIRDDTTTTEGGHWLIKVFGRENRQIEEDDRDVLKSRAFQEWVNSLWNDPENLINDRALSSEKIAWAVAQAQRDLK